MQNFLRETAIDTPLISVYRALSKSREANIAVTARDRLKPQLMDFRVFRLTNDVEDLSRNGLRAGAFVSRFIENKNG